MKPKWILVEASLDESIPQAVVRVKKRLGVSIVQDPVISYRQNRGMFVHQLQSIRRGRWQEKVLVVERIADHMGISADPEEVGGQVLKDMLQDDPPKWLGLLLEVVKDKKSFVDLGDGSTKIPKVSELEERLRFKESDLLLIPILENGGKQ